MERTENNFGVPGIDKARGRAVDHKFDNQGLQVYVCQVTEHICDRRWPVPQAGELHEARVCSTDRGGGEEEGL